MAGDLRVSVLGPLLVELGGVPVELGGPRQRAVLARLVLAGPTGVRPERLLADVWGEESGASASSLHVSVSNLRRVLEPGRPVRTSAVLVSRRSGYVLQTRTDADELAEAVRRGLELTAGDRLAEARELFVGGLGLWRGEPYDDLGEQQWLLRERARLHDLRLVASEQLAELRLRHGDSVQVALDLAPLAELHPSRERLAVLLAVALYRQARQDEALDVLRRVRRHLVETLGLDPGPELRAVEAAVLAQDADPLPRATPPVERAEAVPGTARPGSGSGSGLDVLVGRERPRAVLAAAAASALTGTPSCAVLVGEAGIGKTRLLQDVAEDLAEQSWSVAWGSSTEGSGAPALWPWISVLHQLRDAPHPSEDLITLLDGEPSAAVVAADPAAARWRQQRAVVEHLSAASQAQPVMVVLDDLHWADAATHVLLGELVTALRDARARVLVLVATRPGGQASLTAVLARLARGRALRLELGALSAAQVADMAQAAGFQLDPAALRKRTGGNPFLLQETLALATQTGESPLDVVPATVMDVLRARMALLPGDGPGVLEAASVLGDDIDAHLLAALLDSELPAVETTLDAAFDAGLLAPGGGARLQLRHDLIRETCLAALGPLRRRRLHARAFFLLQERAAGPERLASQALAAGPALAVEAVAACTAAARHAEARLAHDSAVRWWSSAVDAADQVGPAAADRRIAALLGLVGAQLDAGDAVRALDTRARAVQAAREVDDPVLRAQALTALDRPLVWVLRPHSAVALDTVADLERLLEEPPAEVSPTRCRLLATLAVELYGGSQAPRCDTVSAQALGIAEELGQPELLAFALNRRELAIAIPGRERERAELADRLISLGRSAVLPTAELAGHQLAAQARLQLFEVRAADAHAAAARRLAEQLQLSLPRLQQQLWDSSRRLLSGDLDGALALLGQVQDIDWPWWGRDAMLAAVQLSLLLRAGAPERAAALVEQTSYVHPRLAADARALGLASAGQRAAGEHLLRTGPPAALDWAWRAAACVRAQAALAVGTREVLDDAYAALLPEAGLIAAVGSIDAGPVDVHLADLAEALDRPLEAAEHRARLATLCRREGLPAPPA